MIQIVDLTRENAALFAYQFYNVNFEWISRLIFMEDADENVMRNPFETCIDRGGAILLAVETSNNVVVGSVGLKPGPFDEHVGRACNQTPVEGLCSFEVLKFCVSPSYQRRGIGKKLFAAVLERAKHLNAAQLVLWSKKRLTVAHKLYQQYDFTQVELPATKVYDGADVLCGMALK
eukprot:TRINITY_DN7722_c0_g1_i1.p1 TRINITY_DN7722_c0_g1~~TRINITY_DN7722_c0_g1_i1.p1  ORF type:complete len:190 (-),score=35.20 TRINITY_DN7722_c0_g1_i1:9-536(-)